MPRRLVRVRRRHAVYISLARWCFSERVVEIRRSRRRREQDSVVRMDSPPPISIPKRRQPRPGHVRSMAERDLVDEITLAARRIADARDPSGEPIFRTDGVWRVISTIERSNYCLAIADLARAMRLSRQAAHELAHAAERAGVIELAANHDDRRILQALLTPIGRSRLKAGRSAESIWLTTLLNGLGDNELAATTRVVTVIRQRLERDQRELAQRTTRV
jgi:DNA-binding MarR family transcriptional regulator